MPAFKPKLLALLIASACGGSLVALPAAAQSQEDERKVKATDEIVVLGKIGYRNRSPEIAPTLEYDREYFQRFEPLSAGDALKRVPSVTFLSDVTEADAARLRGLSPGYTQVLINGERVPGSGNDRSFLLDRIPAELIERVEVIRSNSASRPGDAMAGALNIILKDSYTLDGGYIRGGALQFDGDEVRESLSGVWGGEVAGGRLIVSANQQSRYNPKVKSSRRFSDAPENNPLYATEFDNREDQTDTRDSDDSALNADYSIGFADGSELRIGGFWVETERSEEERSFEFDHPWMSSGPVMNGGNLETDNHQFQDIEEQNYSINTALTRPMLGGESAIKLGFSRFDSRTDNRESELDLTEAVPVLEAAHERLEIRDDESSLQLSHTMDLGGNTGFEVGVMMLNKTRDYLILAAEAEEDLNINDWNRFAASPLVSSPGLSGFEAISGGDNRIEEERRDIFAAITGEGSMLAWEAGLRYESTTMEVKDRTAEAALAKQDQDFDLLLPSAHLRYALTDLDRLSLSVARSVRRPDFDMITPALLEEEKADNDFIGNPQLEPETAWGLDLGYERRLGDEGVVGINLFYRDVSDLIEVINTGAEGSEGPGTSVLSVANVGDGWVRGVELDLSTPLSFIGWHNTGVFLNYAWLDSEVEDIFGKRAFNDQSEWVYNVGLVQDLPQLAASFGITYRKQDDALGRIVGEDVSTAYDADLEVFAEKRWQSLTLRFVGSNLLDGSKDEVFRKYDSIGDQFSNNIDEYELETEEAGPIFQLIARYAF